MKIGIPKEIKNHEYRVGMTPESVHQVISQGHKVMVETRAGEGIGAGDKDYKKVGAVIGKSAKDVFIFADMIVKVKEPLAIERKKLRAGQVLFTYLHLAADKILTRELMESQAICIAYETITDSNGHLPLLAPMSKIAGRLATQAGAHYLQQFHGGSGKLMGGVPGVSPAKVTILGGGMVGRGAARIALGMGADVVVIDKNTDVMDAISVEFNGQVRTLYASESNISQQVVNADVVIGGVLIQGSRSPKIVSENMVKSMRPGSVIVDVAIDQGGCVATAIPTTHDKPIYIKHGIVHYCVTNMPGSVSHTSTYALNNVTLPFILDIANDGWRQAVTKNPHLKNGLSVVNGVLTCAHSAKSLKVKHTDVKTLL